MKALICSLRFESFSPMWSIFFQSTSNYHARKFGVRGAMPGFIAKRLCPQLIIVPPNFDKYRAVSSEVSLMSHPYLSFSLISCDLQSQIQKHHNLALAYPFKFHLLSLLQLIYRILSCICAQNTPFYFLVLCFSMFFVCLFVCLVFLGLHLQIMEVPRLGVKSEL